MIIIISIAVVLFIGLVLYFAANTSRKPKRKNNSELEEAKQFYEACIIGKDRKAALMAGRIYYSLANSKGMLTMLDELRIANDLSTMPVETCNSEQVTK